MEFKDFWHLVENHGSVACFHKNECEDFWRTLTSEQQQAVYAEIKRKLDSRLFVHFDPTKAVRDNLPKAPRMLTISYEEHYRRYHTDIPQDGFQKIFLPEQHKTIYVKAG